MLGSLISLDKKSKKENIFSICTIFPKPSSIDADPDIKELFDIVLLECSIVDINAGFGQL